MSEGLEFEGTVTRRGRDWLSLSPVAGEWKVCSFLKPAIDDLVQQAIDVGADQIVINIERAT